jgi:hypothetical protein
VRWRRGRWEGLTREKDPVLSGWLLSDSFWLTARSERRRRGEEGGVRSRDRKRRSRRKQTKICPEGVDRHPPRASWGGSRARPFTSALNIDLKGADIFWLQRGRLFQSEELSIVPDLGDSRVTDQPVERERESWWGARRSSGDLRTYDRPMKETMIT